MSTRAVTFHARGMHCTGCEHIIEKSVRKLWGVRRIKADYPTETVTVAFDPGTTSIEAICAAVAQKGYWCSLPSESAIRRNNFKRLAGLILGSGGILLIIYIDTMLISQSGVPDTTQHMSYGLLFMLGLLTGFHCVGMCGGFILSYTADDARLGQRSYLSHVLYGTGKTLSYTLIGALFGLLGAIITFTPLLRGLAGMAAGVFLIIFGLNMLNLFPALRKIRLKVPAALVRFVGQQTRHYHRPLVIGLLLMIACGPLQAMYIMAAGTGSAAEGAKMLFSFGIGTLPVLLSFGVLTSLISGALTHQLLKASGVIVIVLGAVMINRGLILTGSGYDLQSVIASLSRQRGVMPQPPSGDPSRTAVQTITMDVIRSGFAPNHFTLRQGVPVRWVIDGKEITECNKRIVVPSLGLEFDVKEGQQIIQFTPTKAGIIPWSCWMGMLPGRFEVIAEPSLVTRPTAVAIQGTPAPPAATSSAVKEYALPATTITVPPTPAFTETYLIVAGDTLSAIAAKRYRDASRWREIAQANPGLNPHRLRPGQVIRLLQAVPQEHNGQGRH